MAGAQSSVPHFENAAAQSNERSSARFAGCNVNVPPPKYAGRIVLFCASDRPPEYRLDPSLGWKVQGFDLEVNHVPGAHTTMLHPPFVKGLAACFEPYLGAVPEKVN